MVLNDVNKLVHDLEKTELESTTGTVSSQVYCQLLAVYLYQNDLCNAKFLWKRIPDSVKNSCQELSQIWNAGQKMWQRDWPAVHTALNLEWSEYVRHIMQALKESVRERAMSLVSEAYSSVDISVLAGMTGQSLDEAKQSVLERDWSLDETTVKPCKMTKEQATPSPATLTEDQLYKLTQFVSFLEN
ncbi:COP9 signalosome complex subunit 8 [Fopius arisanus]|uniref:COP9 signalosome complex subunit 8 n=1 Tax=Fopius arisanus TaxID=64838 RepID=A0A0C9RWH6_9HYME|nr:PREDICTED: COP9 signalosome complex subunit 8 [Fopius arisanus]